MKMPSASVQLQQWTTSILPAFIVAILPKCPLCLMAILGTFGLGTVISLSWMKPLAVVFLLIAIGTLFLRARHTKNYGPLILGITAAAAIYIFKFQLQIDTGVYISGAALVGASIWNSVLKPERSQEEIPELQKAETEIPECCREGYVRKKFAFRKV